jgi:hypothetical protein
VYAHAVGVVRPARVVIPAGQARGSCVVAAARVVRGDGAGEEGEKECGEAEHRSVGSSVNGAVSECGRGTDEEKAR